MQERKMSLRTAILTPFIIIMIIMVIVFLLLWQANYDWIAQEQGGKIVNALSDNAKQRVSYMLAEPQRINKMYAQVITLNQYFEEDDLNGLQQYTLELSKSVRSEVPQISVISYGDEMTNFLGYRITEAVDQFDLMLQDPRTEGQLNIYQGEDISSAIVGSYEGYDPRTRPWYAPVKENPTVQWSEIYINMDEKNEATISSLVPIIDNFGNFKGVADIDVKLSGINEFLTTEINKGNGIIYIVDEEWSVIAHSLETETVKVTSQNPPEGELFLAVSSENRVESASANYLIKNTASNDIVHRFDIDGEKYFAMISALEDPQGLKWRIVTVIPENDLLGVVRSRQILSTIGIVGLILIASILGLIILTRVVRPIRKASMIASEISKGNWDTQITHDRFDFYETNQLIHALSVMIDNLKSSFYEIKISQEKYQSLVENVDNMIYSISKEGNFISVNTSFEKLVRRERTEIVGAPIESIFSSDENKRYWRNTIEEIIKDKVKMNLQFDFISENNQQMTLKVNLIPILDERGEVELILGSNTDITSLIEAQDEINRLIEGEKEKLEKLVFERTEALRLAMDELVEKEKMASLGSLVSGISHEINTPLGVAVSAGSYIEKLLSDFQLKLVNNDVSKNDFIKFVNNMEESSTIINTNLIRAAELVKSFKEIAVYQSIEGKVKFNLYNYVTATVLSLKHEYKSSAHQIDIDCDKTLEIQSYPGAFSQILTNLLMNSFVHGYSERNNGSILIKFEVNHKMLKMIYKDDGVGISEDSLSRIFDPFFTTNRSKGGSGLGLNIVYNLVTRQLNGKITCQSKLDEGTTFIMEMSLED